MSKFLEKHNHTDLEQQTDFSQFQIQHLLKQVLAYFSRHLKKSAKALDYLSQRGLTHPEMIKYFSMGYCERSFMQVISKGKEGQELRSLLKQAGLITPQGRLMFNDCLVFPIFDSKEHIIQVCGIPITHKSSPRQFYLQDQRQSLFHSQAIEHYHQIIWCNSILDVLSFWNHGFINVVATIDEYSQEYIELFVKHNTQKIYLAFHNKEQEKITAKLLGEHGISSYRLDFPKDISIHQYIQRIRSPQENIKLLIHSASPLHEVVQSQVSLQVPMKMDEAPKQVEWEKKADGYVFVLGDREYSFYGLEKNHSSDSLKLRIKASHNELRYTDNGLDLFSYKTLKSLIRSLSDKLKLKPDIIEHDFDQIIPVLEDLQNRLISQVKSKQQDEEIEFSVQERQKALNDLKDPKLTENILNDFEKIGLVGESNNALIAYLSAISRKEDQPLAVIIQSSSGAGKTTFMDAILSLIPKEEYIKLSSLTSQSLYYMQSNLKHKILALVEEEGAQKASYSLKLLQSEGKLSIAAAGKDPDTGRMVTQQYEVEGPVMIFIATTNVSIDEELQNRCILLSVNESQEQTQRILAHQRQMETLEGLLAR